MSVCKGCRGLCPSHFWRQIWVSACHYPTPATYFIWFYSITVNFSSVGTLWEGGQTSGNSKKWGGANFISETKTVRSQKRSLDRFFFLQIQFFQAKKWGAKVYGCSPPPFAPGSYATECMQCLKEEWRN